MSDLPESVLLKSKLYTEYITLDENSNLLTSSTLEKTAQAFIAEKKWSNFSDKSGPIINKVSFILHGFNKETGDISPVVWKDIGNDHGKLLLAPQDGGVTTGHIWDVEILSGNQIGLRFNDGDYLGSYGFTMMKESPVMGPNKPTPNCIWEIQGMLF